MRRVLLTIIWLLVAAVIAIGGAGLVATMANAPGTAARPELTSEGDDAARAGLDAAAQGITDLAADVDRLGELGRGGLTALVDSDFSTLDASVADGQTLARSIEDRSTRSGPSSASSRAPARTSSCCGRRRPAAAGMSP
jgi:hypothetical protein